LLQLFYYQYFSPELKPFKAKNVPESIQTSQHHIKHIEITEKENFV